MNLLLSTFWTGTEAQTETFTSKSFRNTESCLTGVKNERTDGQFLGWGGEEGRQSTSAAGISDLCECVGRRKVCPWVKDSVSPKQAKVSWSSVSVLLSLCYSCALFLISASCSPEIFPFCSTAWKLRSREEKRQHHIGIKDRAQAGVSKFTTFHLLSLLHNLWSWVLSPIGYTCWRD